MKEAIWIRNFPVYIGIPEIQLTPILPFVDNAEVNGLAKNLEYHSHTKYIHGRQRFITEIVEASILNVDYIPTAKMVADGMMKPLSRPMFVNFKIILGLQDIKQLGKVLCAAQFDLLQCQKSSMTYSGRNALHLYLWYEGHEL